VASFAFRTSTSRVGHRQARVDALFYALQMKHATVRIVMDQGQNVATSETTMLSQMGAEVRFLTAIAYASSAAARPKASCTRKIVAVDDQVVFPARTTSRARAS